VQKRAVVPTIEQQVVRDLVVNEYLPAWCASRARTLDPSNFKIPDWSSFLTPGVARWFLAAIDEGVVEVTSEGDLVLGGTYPDGIFETKGPKDEVPRRMGIRPESFLEVAAVGMLAVRYRWPPERLRFQAPGWAYDFLAYADDEWSGVTIAGEAKLAQKDALKLWTSLEACGQRGDHGEAACSEDRNHHRKYLGLVTFNPRMLWIVGPEAFAAADPDLVFRVHVREGGFVRLRRIEAGELQHEPQMAGAVRARLSRRGAATRRQGVSR
jgi:hypothetical protein